MTSWQVFQLDDAFASTYRTLTKSQKNTVDRYVDLLGEYGDGLSMPHSRPIKGSKNLHELRPKNVRLFYCFLPGRNVVILLGAIKDQKKLRPEIYKKAASLKENVERIGRIAWNRLSQLN